MKKPDDNNKALTTATPQTLAVDPAASQMSVAQVLGQVALIQQIMGATMKDGEHYGRIPGCGDKPTLLKPGAEKLCLTFRMAPTYEISETDGENGHREYRIQCSLSSILTGVFLGQGVGVCSTLEAKYRYRNGAAEVTDSPVPRAYWDIRGDDPAKAQELIGGKGFTVKKVDGKGWMIAKGGAKVEHDNPADNFNTVLKMAKKRALVDAVLTATAASDIFSQDLEDITANIAANQPIPVNPPGNERNGAAIERKGSSEGEDSGTGVNVPEIASEVVPPVQTELPVGDSEPMQPAEPGANDWRETRVHFGKNRGLMVSELTTQQIKWYVESWLPKKEINGSTSVEDVQLIAALKLWKRSSDALARIVAALNTAKIKAEQLEDYLRSKGEAVKKLGGLTTSQLEGLASAMPVLLAEMLQGGD